jgi:hypothetical protein
LTDTDTAIDNSQEPDNSVEPGHAPAPPDQSGDPGTPPADTAAEEARPHKADGGFQRRINRLTREKHEALGRLDALQREVEELRLSRTATPPSGASDQEPRQDQFQRYEDYVAAKAEYRAEQRVRQIEQTMVDRLRAHAAENGHAERVSSFERRFIEQGKGEDAAEVLDELKALPVLSESVADYLTQDADNPFLLGKWLTENPDEVERISRLRPTAAAKELAKVDTRLGSRPSPRTTRAPAPVSTVGGSSAPSGGMPKATDINAWMAWRRQQD